MTEQATAQEYRMYRHTPGGSLWMEEPSFWRDVPASD